LTVRLNQINQQATILQQLRAAQNRVDKLEQETQQTKPRENQDQQQQEQKVAQQQNQDPNSNTNTLNHLAALNIYNNNSLSGTQQQNALQFLQPQNQKNGNQAELKEARSDVQTQQNLLAEVQSSPEGQNQQAKELAKDPLFQKLPQDLKGRADIQDLMKTVEPEALLDPGKAVDSLVDQALAGNKKAFIKLDEYSKNPYDKLQQNAQQGMEKVAAGAEGKPKVLEMIASTATEKSNEASAKLLNLVHQNPRAQQSFERLLRNGSVNFSKVADQAKDMDPAKTASSINTLMKRGNLSKSDQKGAVSVLSELAKQSPTGSAGQIAATGLVRAVKSSPMDIAKSAAQGLKEAVLSGNPNAMSGLQQLAKADDPSRAQLALAQLGEVAKSGASNATAGMETIKDVSQDPGANAKVRNFAVETLGKVANAGGANSQDAVNTLSNIAINKGNPASGNAFNEIGKMNNTTVNNTGAKNTPKQTSSLSDSETYQKVMATQKQMNALSQQSPNFLQKFALNFAQPGMA
jgi:hypothetical protein